MLRPQRKGEERIFQVCAKGAILERQGKDWKYFSYWYFDFKNFNFNFNNWRAESITDLCRILARFSILPGFVRFFALPCFENISRFYNCGQNSLRKPNTNSTKFTCSLTVSPFLILPQLLLPPPSPLCNVDVGSDACQETVRDPKQHWVGGGGGGGLLVQGDRTN